MLLAGLLGGLLLAACADPTALDLELTPNPEVTHRETLVTQLRTLTVVVDSPAGLYPPTPRQLDGVVIQDVDGDGRGELLAELDVVGLGRLPRIRVERGGITAESIDLHLEGKAGGEIIATGTEQGVRFVEGLPTPQPVRFNWTVQHRIPWVVEVWPRDGARGIQAKDLGSVVVTFTKRMNPDSLTKEGVFVVSQLEDDGSETLVPAASITVGSVLGAGVDAPSMAEYRFAASLKGNTFRVKIASEALDAAGRPLDQVPGEPGNQPFYSHFTLGAQQMASIECSPCSSWCAEGGALCPQGLQCNRDTRRCEAVPAPCTEGCPGSTVCDPGLGLCLPDCRDNGVGSSSGCFDPAALCTAAGYCQRP